LIDLNNYLIGVSPLTHTHSDLVLLFAPLASRELFLALVSDRLQPVALLSILHVHNLDVHIAHHWLKVFITLLLVELFFRRIAKFPNELGELAPTRLLFILLCAYFRLFSITVGYFIHKLNFLVY
jgi:hypothetical protein